MPEKWKKTGPAAGVEDGFLLFRADQTAHFIHHPVGQI